MKLSSTAKLVRRIPEWRMSQWMRWVAIASIAYAAGYLTRMDSKQIRAEIAAAVEEQMAEQYTKGEIDAQQLLRATDIEAIKVKQAEQDARLLNVEKLLLIHNEVVQEEKPR